MAYKQKSQVWRRTKVVWRRGSDGFEIHQVDIINCDEPVSLMKYERFRNDAGINLICLSLVDVIFQKMES